MLSRLRGHRRLPTLVLRLGLIATGSYLLPIVHGTFWSQGQGMWRPPMVVLSFVTSGLAFCLLGAGTAARRPRRFLPLVLAAFWLSTAGSFYVALKAQRPGDPIPDNVLLSSYSAELLLQGENPYTWDMSDVFSAFGVSSYFMTPQLDGSATSVLPYPALHFLLLVPVHGFGLDGARGLYVLCHLLLGTLLFLRAPGTLRPIVLLPLWVSAEYLHFALSFVSDGVWSLLLLGTILTWRKPTWRAVLYGLACAYKQPPWLLAPFLLVRLLIDEQDPDRRPPLARAVAFFGVAGGVFALLNAPFLFEDLPAWWARVFQPLAGELVFLGVGLTSLTQLGLVELPKAFYSTTGLVVMLALLLLYLAHFRRWRNALWLLPGLVLWCSYRSLESYFVYWVPLLIAVVVEPRRGATALPQPTSPAEAEGRESWSSRFDRLPPRIARYAQARQHWSAGVVAGACLVVIVAAFHFVRTGEAVAVELVDAPVRSSAGEIGDMVLLVHNTTDSVLRPRFAVQKASWQPYPWETVSGPESLAPGESARYGIRTQLPYRTLNLVEGGQVVITEATGDYRVRGTLKIAPDDSLDGPRDVFNSGYRLLAEGGDVPWGWTLQRATPYEPMLEQARTADGAPAIRLSLRVDAGHAGWQGVGIAQGLPFPDGGLWVWVNPPAPGPDDEAAFTAAYGVEFHDGEKRLWVLFGPSQAGEGYLEANHYCIRRSLASGSWSEQAVDLRAVYARLGWPLPPLKRTIRGNVELLTRGTSLTLFVAARNRVSAPRLSAEFGPVRLESSPLAPWRRIRERVARPREYARALAQLEADRRNLHRARALLEAAQSSPD